MTTEIPVPEGPPCDFCTDWPAVGSLMNLADYTTQKFCASCGPAFLVGIVEAMTGAQIMVPVTGTSAAGGGELPAPVTPAADIQPEPERESIRITPSPEMRAAVLAAAGLEDQAEQGSKADHWASTTHVRRSTHGHRGGSRAKSGDDE